MRGRAARVELGAGARCASLLVGACFCLGPVSAAFGELLRCKGPDGGIVYTDDKSLCPDAEPFEPQGQVTRAETPVRKRETLPLPGTTGRADTQPGVDPQPGFDAQLEEAEERRWRLKKATKEAELRTIAEHRSELKQFVSVCNRRGKVVSYDAAGIEYELRCWDLQRRFEALREQEAQIRDYLENGLPEECRRAGCLPGWIR